MKGDFSKRRFNPKDHMTHVLMQQGRVLLDADWNEQGDIVAHKISTMAEDLMGPGGAPMHNGGFHVITGSDDLTAAETNQPFGKQILLAKAMSLLLNGNMAGALAIVNGIRTARGDSPLVTLTADDVVKENKLILAEGNEAIGTLDPEGDFYISPGRYYVEGMLCQNDNAVSYTKQPDLPEAKLPTEDGTYFIYLDVWHRHLTALEEPSIREVALGGPDTTTRVKTVWQVKALKAGVDANCTKGLPGTATQASTGGLSAKSEPPDTTDDPCGLAASGGYTRLENQLYRAEIHKGGPSRASSTFKWSRDNGTVLTRWQGQNVSDPHKLIVSSFGRDELLGFKPGNWIELIDNDLELLGSPGLFARILKVEGNYFLVDKDQILDPSGTVTTLASYPADYFKNKNPRLRRWDSPGIVKLNSDNSWLPLEDGVQVRFDEGSFSSGDYWMIPARTATADIEWPKDSTNNPVIQPPQGIKHHYALLGILKVVDKIWTSISDCRPIFPPMTELTTLYYVSGDGQEAMAGNPLPQPLKVGVSNGQWPVQGARIVFSLLPPGNGTINPTTVVLTDQNGIASCQWNIGSAALSQQVMARLLNADDQPVHLPIIFTANQSVASNHDSCCITVGKGGMFQTIEEAFIKMINRQDICLCLLSGEHELRKVPIEAPKRTISIKGCDAVIIVTAPVSIQANRIELHDLRILPKGPVTISLFADETTVEQCTFINNKPEKVPFLLVGSSPNSEAGNVLHFKKNRMLVDDNIGQPVQPRMGAGVALALMSRVSAWLEDNIIFQGDVALNYNEQDGAKENYIDWTDQAYRAFIERFGSIPFIFNSQSAFLNLRGNKLVNVKTISEDILKILSGAVNDPANNPIPNAYRTVTVTENEFVRSQEEDVPFQNSFIAEQIIMSSNVFQPHKEKTEIVARIIGEKGIFVGNMGRGDMTRIQTILRNKESTANMLIVS